MKSTAQIFGPFGDQKILSVSEFWFTHEGRNVTNSKLGWAVVFTARYARRNKRKTFDLGARLRKLSKTVADLLDNHEGDIPGDGSRLICLPGRGIA